MPASCRRSRPSLPLPPAPGMPRRVPLPSRLGNSPTNRGEDGASSLAFSISASSESSSAPAGAGAPVGVAPRVLGFCRRRKCHSASKLSARHGRCLNGGFRFLFPCGAQNARSGWHALAEASSAHSRSMTSCGPLGFLGLPISEIHMWIFYFFSFLDSENEIISDRHVAPSATVPSTSPRRG